MTSRFVLGHFDHLLPLCHAFTLKIICASGKSYFAPLSYERDVIYGRPSNLIPWQKVYVTSSNKVADFAFF